MSIYERCIFLGVVVLLLQRTFDIGKTFHSLSDFVHIPTK